ncbi:MAG: C-terminal binding protein [Chloroflexota bacterium]|nr:C-terminal binding protein [Chloroflexota bacterium]
MGWKVLITDHVWPTTDPERAVLEAAGAKVIVAPDGNEDTLINLAKDVDAIMTCFAKVTEKVIRSAEKCVAIGRFGVGTDNIDVATATELGIPVTYVPDYCVDEVSDHVLAMLHTWNRKIALFDQSVKSEGWGHLGLTMRIKRLRGKTIGIVGFGRIGQAVAEKASVFGLKILASDPVTPKEIVESYGGQLVAFEELLEQSDFVSLHAPLTPATEKLIGPREFDLMKDDSFLINAARGPLIDESALYDALSNGKIGGAGLDVMVENEPPKDHPLMQLENILITPHTAFFSQESTLELEERAASEVVRVYKNIMPENLVNKEVLDHPNPKRSLQS